MAGTKTDIWVYAHWMGMEQPKCIGILSAQQAKGRKVFTFSYDKSWINSAEQVLLDPDIAWYPGAQYPKGKDNFGVFMDSMPDTWGRKLMQRRVGQLARESKMPTPTLYEIDYLLGVHDQSRMGALRFKVEQDGPFLDDNPKNPTPPWASIRELQHSAEILEADQDDKAINQSLALLLAPGSSLGGARPKANILDDDGHPWIAKFPSGADQFDKAAWEYLAYLLATKAGIQMSECRIEKVYGPHHTFFTKRFDRINGERIHFASAMTMTGRNEEINREDTPSYLDLAEFLQYYGASITADLAQLWRRLIFNIAISNTDDHLRNHGYILVKNGWRLAPAYDLNPSIDKDGLELNIDTHNNALDLDLARSVGEYFQLKKEDMNEIIEEVMTVVSTWKEHAKEIGLSRAEQEKMSGAFMVI
ncbi:HipA domain-containing protein [Mucilaginibacter sp. PAMB04168]|uniref:type II toxin-antitoxin system HipA family toxin n=1 Tax=Mucilaginibacter sp. PAMB04168 TaxID=3138567 RepID=UPI0031F6CB3D